jgi:hypothetical protein
MEGRLAARRGQQDLLERRHVGDEPLRELDLDLGDADAHEVDGPTGGGDCGVDVGVVVAEQGRAEGGVVVREDASRRVGERRAARGGDHEVLEARDLTLAAVDAARDDGRRPRREVGLCLRCGRAHRSLLRLVARWVRITGRF